MPRLNRLDRDRVHAELTTLLGTGGALAQPPPSIAAFLDDDLRAGVLRQYRALANDVRTEGRAVIVTAGPPGAGKSTALDSLLDGHRRIDPDEIKDLLLHRLEAAGLLAAREGHVLSDGGLVSPAELSWWVHHAANDIAEDVRQRALSDGENFAIEGTLQWDQLPEDYSAELADNDYEDVTVLDIEVPRAVAFAQARDRWWGTRNSGAPLGGRFMAHSSFDRFYPDSNGVSITATRARELYATALDFGVEARIACVTRNLSGKEFTALISRHGVTEWPTAGPLRTRPRGAACIKCGKPLRADSSIVRGLGRDCAAS